MRSAAWASSRAPSTWIQPRSGSTGRWSRPRRSLGPKYAAYQAPTVNGAKASRPELLDVKMIDYDFDYCGSNKNAIVDKFTNEIAGADNLKE